MDQQNLGLEPRVQEQKLPLSSSVNFECKQSPGSWSLSHQSSGNNDPHYSAYDCTCHISSFLLFIFLHLWVYSHWGWCAAYIRNLSGFPSPSWEMALAATGRVGGHRWCWPAPTSKVLLRSGRCAGSSASSPTATGIFVKVAKTSEVNFRADHYVAIPYGNSVPWRICVQATLGNHSHPSISPSCSITLHLQFLEPKKLPPIRLVIQTAT